MARPRKSDAQFAGTRIAGTPIKPPALGAAQSIQWDLLVQQLEESGVVLTTAHAGLLCIAASIAVEIEDCAVVLKDNGSRYTQAGTGGTKLHPAAARLDYLQRDLAKILINLGAAKPGAQVPDEENDPLAKLLRRK